MDGYYIKCPTGIFEPLQFTPVFYQFNGNSYIYGIKGGKLYRNSNGKSVEVADGLKNFRLCELKRISKAKK
ncbi:MAG: hypothetical protein II968_02760 [Selenomonadaceae bacterium]|nr:hypothetical protein [Selenomonadaceae bacterium]